MKLGLAISVMCVAIMASTPLCYAQTPASEARLLPKQRCCSRCSCITTRSKNLAEINQELKKNGYYDQFPPPGVTVDSWYVVMGIGQIVTLACPGEQAARGHTRCWKIPRGARTARSFFRPTTTRLWPSSSARPLRNKKP